MKRIIIIAIFAISTLIFVSSPALAALVYSMTLTVTNTNSTKFTQLPVIVAFNTQQLIDNGYLSASGLDLNVKQGSTVLPALITDDKLLTVVNLPANNNVSLAVSTGNAPLDSMPIIVGHDGYITTSDNATLEPGSNFDIDIAGYFDTTAGSNKNILYKEHALKIYVSAANALKVVTLNGADSEVVTVTEVNVTSGIHSLVVVGDGVNLSLSVDEGTPVTASIGSGVPDSNYDWIWDQNNVMPYINYIKMALN